MARMRDEISEFVAVRDLAIERRGGIERHHDRAGFHAGDDIARDGLDGDIGHGEDGDIGLGQCFVRL